MAAIENRSGTLQQQSSHCVRCGRCTVVCPVYQVVPLEPLTARGKLHLLAAGTTFSPGEVFQDLLGRCLLCGACEQVCSRHLPITALIAEARDQLPRLFNLREWRKAATCQTLQHPSLLIALSKVGARMNALPLLPMSSGLRLKLDFLSPSFQDVSAAELDAAASLLGKKGANGGETTDEAEPLNYFTGCLAAYLQPAISRDTRWLCQTLVGKAAEVVEGQGCCGLAPYAAGKKETAQALALKNITAFAGNQGPILTSCASCSAHLQNYPALFEGDPALQDQAIAFSQRVREFSTYFLAQGGLGDFFPAPPSHADQQDEAAVRVYYHDPCHLKHQAETRVAPRRLLEQVLGVERVGGEKGTACCGQGGLFSLNYPELSQEIFEQAQATAATENPDYIVTSCTGCLIQWYLSRAVSSAQTQVLHLASFIVGQVTTPLK